MYSASQNTLYKNCVQHVYGTRNTLLILPHSLQIFLNNTAQIRGLLTVFPTFFSTFSPFLFTYKKHISPLLKRVLYTQSTRPIITNTNKIIKNKLILITGAFGGVL